MAVTYVGVNSATAQVAGNTTTAGTTPVVPALPAGTVAGDRVFVFQASSNTTGLSPAGWTALAKDVQVGVTGTAPGAAVGRRYISVYYRDYDGSWTMPTFALTSATNNSNAISAISVRKASTDTWDTPTVSSPGHDTGDDTAYSAVIPSFALITGGFGFSVTALNDNVNSTGTTITPAAGTVANVTERTDGGTANGNDVRIITGTFDVTAGGTGTITRATTLAGNSQGGTVIVQQTVTSAAPPKTGGGSGVATFTGFGTGAQPGPTPSLVGSFANNPGSAQTSTATFTLPAGVQDGDVGAFQVSVNGGPTTVDPVTPTGWTLISVLQNAANNLRSWLFRKTLTAAEAGTTVTAEFAVGFRWNVTGVVVRNGTLDASTEWTDSSDDLTLAIPSLNPTAVDTLMVTLAGIRYAGTTPLGVSSAGSWTELQDIATTNATVPTIGAWAGSRVLHGDSSTAEDMVFASAARANGFLMAFAYSVPVVTKQGGGSSSATFTGAGAGKRTPKGSGAGTWTATGTGAGKRIPKGSGSNSALFTGSSTGKRTPRGTGAGSWTATGAGTGKRVPKGSGTGSWTATGAGAGKRTPKGGAAGTWTVTGAGTGRRTPKGTGAGVWTATGAGSGTAPVIASAGGGGSSTAAFTGSGVGRRIPKATGAGSWTATGAGTGRRVPKATSSSTATFTGAGTGLRVPKATGAGTWTVTGAGGGFTTRSGGGSGTATFVGFGGGGTGAQGIGTGLSRFTGAGTGTRTPKGGGSSATAFTGDGTGRRAPKGTGSTSSALFTGASTGKRTPKTTATSLSRFSGLGTGRRAPKGTGAGSWRSTGAGTGRVARYGTGAGVWTATGSGTGVSAAAVPVLTFDYVTATLIVDDGTAVLLDSGVRSALLTGNGVGAATVLVEPGAAAILTSDGVGSASLPFNTDGQAILESDGVASATLSVA